MGGAGLLFLVSSNAGKSTQTVPHIQMVICDYFKKKKNTFQKVKLKKKAK